MVTPDIAGQCTVPLAEASTIPEPACPKTASATGVGHRAEPTVAANHGPATASTSTGQLVYPPTSLATAEQGAPGNTASTPAAMSAPPSAVHIMGAQSKTIPAIARLVTAGVHVVVYGSDMPPIVEDWAEQGIITWRRHQDVPGPGETVLCYTANGVRPAIIGPQTGGGNNISTWVQSMPQSTFGSLSQSIRIEPGQVWLVGAGPGRPELVTIGCLAAVQQADVVVADRLVSVDLLAAVPPTAELIDVAKLPRGRHTTQEAIHEVLIARAQAGHRVVRLKGGDPFLFGRGGEEVLACQEANVPVRWLPGVTSAVAVPAAAGVPVTHRGLSQGVTVVSGHVPPGHAASTVDWAAIAQTGTTVVVLMGVANIGPICAALRCGGMAADMPVVAACDRGFDLTATHRTTIGALADGQTAAITAPAVFVIGLAAQALG